MHIADFGLLLEGHRSPLLINLPRFGVDTSATSPLVLD